MKMITFNFWILACLSLLVSCEKVDMVTESGDYEIRIEAGEHWLHDFPLFLGLSKANPPQFAVWVEDTSGNYLSTLFATYKIATEGWQANKGNRRKESLPHWCFQRGVTYSDGLYLPTKENPLPDGITGATPKADKTLLLSPSLLEPPFVIKAEFNHSVDFNSLYPKNAQPGEINYSGGEMGSGQPAVVYSVIVLPDTEEATLTLVGHSSPDGSDGLVYSDLESLTTARSIVGSIRLVKR